MTNVTNKFYHDNSNGWLAVKFKLLVELGIANKISKNSFIKGQTVYLDEDTDMPIYVDAQKDRGVTVNSVAISHDKRSIVRNYNIYHADDNASASVVEMIGVDETVDIVDTPSDPVTESKPAEPATEQLVQAA